VLRPPLLPQEVPPITLAAGVAVAEALADFLDGAAAPALKWPNDVQLDGKKVAAILTEMSSLAGPLDHLVVGMGAALNQAAVPAGLAAIAPSLRRARGGRAVARAAFAAALCARLEHWHDRFVDRSGRAGTGAPAVVAAWRGYARFFGRRVTVSA